MKDLLYKDKTKWFTEDIRKDEWTTVFKSYDGEFEQHNVYAILFPENLITEFLEYSSWTLNCTQFQPGYAYYHDKEPEYFRWGIESAYEPIVYHQFYNNIYNSNKGIVDEFLLFNNLFFEEKSQTFISVDISSEQNVVIRVKSEEKDSEIQIRTDSLRRYLCAKNMVLGVQMEMFRYSGQNLKDFSDNDYLDEKAEDHHYVIDFQEAIWQNDLNKKLNSRLIGKKLMRGFENLKIQSDYDEFEASENCEFIVDIDIDSGKPIYETCKKSEMNMKEDKYHYLLPIFFSREVLEKYYNNTAIYSVDDSSVSMKGSWRMEIDNNIEEYISAYLGDLQRLPFAEQLIWKSHNLSIRGKLSDRKIKTDFLSIWNEPKIADLKFKNQYKKTNNFWLSKYQFEIFCKLDLKDEHCLKSLRMPLRNDVQELDTLILYLAKIMIDYLNVKGFNNYFKSNKIEIDSHIGSIDKLKIFMEYNGIIEKDEIHSFYKDLQDLRSKGSAHRKSSDYEKSLKRMNLHNLTEIHKFKQFLNRASNVLERLEVSAY